MISHEKQKRHGNLHIASSPFTTHLPPIRLGSYFAISLHFSAAPGSKEHEKSRDAAAAANGRVDYFYSGGQPRRSHSIKQGSDHIQGTGMRRQGTGTKHHNCRCDRDLVTWSVYHRRARYSSEYEGARPRNAGIQASKGQSKARTSRD